MHTRKIEHIAPHTPPDASASFDHDAGLIAALRLLACPCSATDPFVRGWMQGRRIARILIANGCRVMPRNGD